MNCNLIKTTIYNSIIADINSDSPDLLAPFSLLVPTSLPHDQIHNCLINDADLDNTTNNNHLIDSNISIEYLLRISKTIRSLNIYPESSTIDWEKILEENI